MKEYAYDVEVSAVVRVEAPSESVALAIVGVALDSMDLADPAMDMINNTYVSAGVRMRLTEARLHSSRSPKLFEINSSPISDGV